MSTLVDLYLIYDGSDGDVTVALYKRLEQFGSLGYIATNLFRAQKSSSRAKVYRGGGYRGKSYDRKQWAIGNLCEALSAHAGNLGLTWGWGADDKAEGPFKHVLYVDLPTGQVSFHSPERGLGPDYGASWDGITGKSADRILRWIARILEGSETRGAA